MHLIRGYRHVALFLKLFFWCQRFTNERKELKDTLGSTPEPETLVKLMLTTEER